MSNRMCETCLHTRREDGVIRTSLEEPCKTCLARSDAHGTVRDAKAQREYLPLYERNPNVRG